MKNLSWVIVQDFQECMNLLKLGELNRSYAQTNMNHQSSRSHTVYRLFIEAMAKSASETEPEQLGFTAVLNFVDLAGSERANVHEMKGSGVEKKGIGMLSAQEQLAISN